MTSHSLTVSTHALLGLREVPDMNNEATCLGQRGVLTKTVESKALLMSTVSTVCVCVCLLVPVHVCARLWFYLIGHSEQVLTSVLHVFSWIVIYDS